MCDCFFTELERERERERERDGLKSAIIGLPFSKQISSLSLITQSPYILNAFDALYKKVEERYCSLNHQLCKVKNL